MEKTLGDEVCLLALNYPLSVIRNTRREDIVFIAFQFWVLGMSIVALLNESIPYIVASFLTHAMAMAWNAFQRAHTAHFRTDFNRIITNGACAGVNLLPKYWDARRTAEIPGLVFNVIGLVVFGALSWKLFRLFGWQTFRRMGASRTMGRIYKLVLSLGVAIQLGVFFTVVQVSLWLDQLFNSVVHDSAPFLKLHKGMSFVTLFLLIPWLITGWVAVKRELRLPMIVFIVFAILYIIECGVMFFSVTFRFTFLTWRFFSIMASTSLALTCLIVLLGIACYLNFDHGFAAYLKGTEDRPTSPEDAGHAAFVDYGSSLYGRSEKSSEKHFFSDADLRGPSPLPTFILNPSTAPTQEYPFDLTPYTLKQNRDSNSTQGSNGIIGSSYFGIRGLQRTRTNSTGPDWSFVTPGVGVGVGGAPVAFPPPVSPSDTRSSTTSGVMEYGALNRQQSTKTYTTWESFVVGSEEPALPAAAVGSNRTTAEFGGGGIQRSGTQWSASTHRSAGSGS